MLADTDSLPGEEVPPPEVSAVNSPVPSQLWIVTGGAVGVALGFITSLEEPARPLAIGGALVYLVLRAVRAMRLGNQLDFQLQNFVLWLGAAVGGLASEMFYSQDVFLATFMAWFVTSVLGGLLVQFGPREEEGGAVVQPQGTQPPMGSPQVAPPEEG